MKTFLMLFAVFLAAGAAAKPVSESQADAVAARDRELNALIVKHATDTARDFYDDQFVLTTSSGKMKDKYTILGEIASEDLALTANETTDVVVRVRDKTALLTGILHQAGTYKGKPFDIRLRVTDTWVFTDHSWRILAGHASAM